MMAFPICAFNFTPNPGIFIPCANVLSLDTVGIKFNSVVLNSSARQRFTEDGSRTAPVLDRRSRVNPSVTGHPMKRRFP